MGDDLQAATHVPDGSPLDLALARTTDLAVVAHPDDLELLAPGVIGDCRDDPDRWFTGIVCTDGAGSVEPADGSERLVARRAAEQRAAADLGGYGAVVQLQHPTAGVRDPRRRSALVGDLVDLVDRVGPVRAITHDLTDRHLTHVGVALAVLDAVRRLAPDRRPTSLLGVEGWRSLAWLAPADVVRLDVSDHTELAARLLACFTSQVGPKRYDLAAPGRRRANATFEDPTVPDHASEVCLAVDLTELVRDDDLDPADLVDRLSARAAADLAQHLAEVRGRA